MALPDTDRAAACVVRESTGVAVVPVLILVVAVGLQVGAVVGGLDHVVLEVLDAGFGDLILLEALDAYLSFLGAVFLRLVAYLLFFLGLIPLVFSFFPLF
jgi:hypothetical protein